MPKIGIDTAASSIRTNAPIPQNIRLTAFNLPGSVHSFSTELFLQVPQSVRDLQLSVILPSLLSSIMKLTLRLLNYVPRIKFVGGPHSHSTLSVNLCAYQLHRLNVHKLDKVDFPSDQPIGTIRMLSRILTSSCRFQHANATPNGSRRKVAFHCSEQGLSVQ